MSHASAAEPLICWEEGVWRPKIMKETWGHLAPKKNKLYRGHITFAIGRFGSDNLNPMPLECSLVARDGEELDGSPWFYDAMIDFLYSLRKADQEGSVWRFDGSFRNYNFVGNVTKAELKF
jgi:hypothetical protein